MALCSPVVGKLYNRVGPFWLILCGTLLMLVANWELSHIQLEATMLYATVWMTIRYAGIALAFMPVTNAGMSSIPKEKTGHASSVTNWMRQATGALSIGVFSSILAARTSTHQQELSDGAGTAAQQLKEQSMTLGVQDVFLVATVICVVTIPLIFLLKERKRQSSGAVQREIES
jgi:MFS family permease